MNVTIYSKINIHSCTSISTPCSYSTTHNGKGLSSECTRSLSRVSPCSQPRPLQPEHSDVHRRTLLLLLPLPGQVGIELTVVSEDKGRQEGISGHVQDGTYRVILKAGCHPVAIAQVAEH